MDRLHGVRARFINSNLVIHGEKYKCYYISEHKIHDYIVFWLHKKSRRALKFVPIYFVIPSITDDEIHSLFLLVMEGLECNKIGKLSTDDRTVNACYKI